jgi:hypothetical protein
MSDPDGGKTNGVAWCPSSVDPKTWTRSSSETAYRTLSAFTDHRVAFLTNKRLSPVAPLATRQNLLVITNALATKINWSKKTEHAGGDELVVARGISFVSSANPKTVYKAVSPHSTIDPTCSSFQPFPR